jgi:deoxyribodipyrimidine photo-lyase
MSAASGPAQPPQLVWFKRDLRIHDHRPLLEASRGARCCRYWWWSRSSGGSRRLGAPVGLRRRSDARSCARRWPAWASRWWCAAATWWRCWSGPGASWGWPGLWSHEETGNGWTYARDRRVAAWARSHGIAWRELPQFGVVRRLASRDGWARRWEAQMAEPILPPPAGAAALSGLDPGPLPTAAAGPGPRPLPRAPAGRPLPGLALLHSFLAERGRAYQRELSSPQHRLRSCSRLSPHLAWGTLSLREVVQASRAAAAQAMPPAAAGPSMSACTGTATSSRSWRASRIWSFASCIRSPPACAMAKPTGWPCPRPSGWRPGVRGAPACPSWMPACAPWPPRAGSTSACAPW